jgi:nicotinate-nucleotide--dimethylbenzimidazole phosphoribosyltransferase
MAQVPAWRVWGPLLRPRVGQPKALPQPERAQPVRQQQPQPERAQPEREQQRRSGFLGKDPEWTGIQGSHWHQDPDGSWREINNEREVLLSGPNGTRRGRGPMFHERRAKRMAKAEAQAAATAAAATAAPMPAAMHPWMSPVGHAWMQPPPAMAQPMQAPMMQPMGALVPMQAPMMQPTPATAQQPVITQPEMAPQVWAHPGQHAMQAYQDWGLQVWQKATIRRAEQNANKSSSYGSSSSRGSSSDPKENAGKPTASVREEPAAREGAAASAAKEPAAQEEPAASAAEEPAAREGAAASAAEEPAAREGAAASAPEQAASEPDESASDVEPTKRVWRRRVKVTRRVKVRRSD